MKGKHGLYVVLQWRGIVDRSVSLPSVNNVCLPGSGRHDSTATSAVFLLFAGFTLRLRASRLTLRRRAPRVTAGAHQVRLGATGRRGGGPPEHEEAMKSSLNSDQYRNADSESCCGSGAGVWLGSAAEWVERGCGSGSGV
ncbi:hypothetical protein EYF80_028905 [Liparis tanakae]|uniref:Uncharacterized protein n=1 Tax=Liparis tanakae TaxID=230148 RepID=A0A4Z2H5X7_9TELE|nr:hypothetical protein EYF80_028905 [Liparis tanakae]